MAREDDRRDDDRRDEISHKEFNEFKEYCLGQFKSLNENVSSLNENVSSLNEKVSSLTGTVGELLREIRAPPESHPQGPFRPKEEHRKTSQSRPPKSKTSYFKKDKNTSSRPTRAKRIGEEEEEDKTTSMAWDIFERERNGNKWTATCVMCDTVYKSPRTNVLYKHIERCYRIDMSNRRNVRPQYTKPTNGIVTISVEEWEEGARFWASKRNAKEAELPTESISREQNRWTDKGVRSYLIRPLSEEETKVFDTWKYIEEGYTTLDHYDIDTGKPYLDNVPNEDLAGLRKFQPEGDGSAYYTTDKVMAAFFTFLRMRSNEQPESYLRHFSFESYSVENILKGKGEKVINGLKKSANRLKNLKCASKVLLPVCYESHWMLFYADIRAQKLVWLDSFQVRGYWEKCNQIPEWFKEHLLPFLEIKNASDWEVKVQTGIPQQQNGYDCGIFVMAFAVCLLHGEQFPFDQRDIVRLRYRFFVELCQRETKGTGGSDVHDRAAGTNEAYSIEELDADSSVELVNAQDEP